MAEKWSVEHWFTGADGTDHWYVHGPQMGADNAFLDKDEADLIAAAPETARQRDLLLEALKAIVEMDEDGYLFWQGSERGVRSVIDEVIAECEKGAGE